MKTLADIKRRLRVGGRLLCVENTYRPKLNGIERIICKVQTNGVFCHFGDEKRFWTPLPKAKDLTIIDDDTFQFWLFEPGGHYVRLRFLD